MVAGPLLGAAFATLVGALSRLTPALATGIQAFAKSSQPPQGQPQSQWQQFLAAAIDKQHEAHREAGQHAGETTGNITKFISNPSEPIGLLGGAVAREGLGSFVGLMKSLDNPLTSFGEQIRNLGDEVLETKRAFADLNGRHAAAFMRLDLSRELGAIDLANRTSRSTSQLTDRQIELEKALRPLQSTVENFKNRALAGMIELTLAVVKGADKVSNVTEKVLDYWLGGSKLVRMIREGLKEMGKGDEGGPVPDRALRDFLRKLGGRVGDEDSLGSPIRPALPWGPRAPKRGFA